MNDKVKVFLEGVVEKKTEQLLGIALDTQYYVGILGTNENEEDELRKELEVEQEKREIDKMGKTLKDDRDFDKIGKLNARIDDITKAREEKKKLDDMKETITQYLNTVKNPSEETLAILTTIAESGENTFK